MTVAAKTRYRQMHAAGFLLTDTGYTPGFVRARHVHETAEFCFVVDGTLRESMGPRQLPGHRFDMSFKPAGLAHSSEAGRQGARCLVIEVPIFRLAPHGSAARLLDGPAFFPNGALAGLGLGLMKEMASGDDLAPLAIEGLSLELVAKATRQQRMVSSRTPIWMETVRELLHDCFSERLCLATIARQAGVHPAHLAQVFRREQGCTIGEYIRRVRVNYARHQLVTTDRSLAEIALSAGFCDQGHLTRTFKRLTGTTPARYRLDPLTS